MTGSTPGPKTRLTCEELARLSQIPVATIRRFDSAGLLQPEGVDEETGCRYYSACQLPRLCRITVLLDLGLGVEQIDALLKEDLSPGQIRGIMRLKQADIEQRVEDWLLQIEREDSLLAGAAKDAASEKSNKEAESHSENRLN